MLQMYYKNLTFAEHLQKSYKTMAYKIDPDLCIACGSCEGECPSGAIQEGDSYSINPDLCVDCGACESVCPVEAISAGD